MESLSLFWLLCRAGTLVLGCGCCIHSGMFVLILSSEIWLAFFFLKSANLSLSLADHLWLGSTDPAVKCNCSLAQVAYPLIVGCSSLGFTWVQTSGCFFLCVWPPETFLPCRDHRSQELSPKFWTWEIFKGKGFLSVPTLFPRNRPNRGPFWQSDSSAYVSHSFPQTPETKEFPFLIFRSWSVP